METIKSLFRELYFEIFKVVFLNSLMDATIFFLLAHMGFSFINLGIYYSGASTAAFFMLDMIFRVKKMKLKYVEDTNPDVKEILRTARDSYGRDNFMVKACYEDLVKRMKAVSTGNLLSPGLVAFKAIIIAVLCCVMLVIYPYYIDLPGMIQDFSLSGWNGAKQVKAHDIYGIELNESDDIYGESNVALLGNQEVKLNINPELNEINLKEVEPVEEKTFQAGQFPDDVEAVADQLSEEKAPKESKIAIAYNLKLKEQQIS